MADNQEAHYSPVGFARTAFVNGYALYDEPPLMDRAKTACTIGASILAETMDPEVLRFIESTGEVEGLYAQVYKRRDRMWMKYDRAIKRWAKMLSLSTDQELLGDTVQRHINAGTTTKERREAVRSGVLVFLIQSLRDLEDLAGNAHDLLAQAEAEAKAEGSAAAGAMLAQVNKHKVPDIGANAAKSLKELHASRDYGKNAAAALKSVLGGIAGDVAIASVAAEANGASQEDQNAAAFAAVGAGVGASFYTDSYIHAAFAAAMLALFSSAEESPTGMVNFTTVGDERVCPECLAAEDNNPYLPADAPPIPLHGECRCWYTPAE